jgi:hypothetical protein
MSKYLDLADGNHGLESESIKVNNLIQPVDELPVSYKEPSCNCSIRVAHTVGNAHEPHP